MHAGRRDLRALGVHAPPLDLSTTYPLPNLIEANDNLREMGDGGRPDGSFVYSRLHNPTVARVEQALAELEHAEASVAFSSGMAAVTACLLAARTRGSHIVALRPVYGGSDALLCSGILGLEVSWASEESLAQVIRPDTALVVLESPANPTLELYDIDAVVASAGDVPVVVDSTLATPVLQNPLDHGASFVVHSATKALSGHGDVLAGVVACSEDDARMLRKIRVLTGAVLHPQAAFLLHRGLQTLPLRVRAAQTNATQLADRLADHPMVEQVFFPGHRGSDPRRLLGRQMRGPGTIVAFRVRGGREAAQVVMASVRLITPAVSLGCTDTLIQHPASLTHAVVEESVRQELSISDGLLRLSAGIEDASDLWEDLNAALEGAHDMYRSVELRSQALGAVASPTLTIPT